MIKWFVYYYDSYNLFIKNKNKINTYQTGVFLEIELTCEIRTAIVLTLLFQFYLSFYTSLVTSFITPTMMQHYSLVISTFLDQYLLESEFLKE